MNYIEQIIDTTTNYIYTFENNTSCIFSVSKGGIIYVEIKEKVPYSSLCLALTEVSNIIERKGEIPKIYIKKTNDFLNNLARKCNFKRVTCRGVRFSIWCRPSTEKALE